MPVRSCAKICVIIAVLFAPLMSAAQETAPLKLAVVIGNANYTDSTIAGLRNPINDANDMNTALTELGFKVEMILNGSLDQMEAAIINLKRRLGAAKNSYGFFYYAGHAVESKGHNYLIPADARIPGENMLRERAMSVQTLLMELEEAGNDLNIIVLDSCRNNPFGWSRGGNRGLAVVDHIPTGSVIVYATGAGQVAQDGDGKNGLFTSQLLKNLKVPGLELQQVIKRTGADVMRESGNAQVPAVYYQFFGEAYLGTLPASDNSGSRTIINAEAVAIFTRAEDFFAKENYAEALTAVNEAIRLDPTNSAFYNARGKYRLFSIGNYDTLSDRDGKDVLADYNEAIRLDPKNPEWYFWRASLYLHGLRQQDKAFADFTVAIRLEPDNAVWYEGRGLAYERQGQFNEAIADYTEAIRLHPEKLKYYLRRGDLYFNWGEYGKALLDYAEAARISPDDAYTQNMLKMTREQIMNNMRK